MKIKKLINLIYSFSIIVFSCHCNNKNVVKFDDYTTMEYFRSYLINQIMNKNKDTNFFKKMFLELKYEIPEMSNIPENKLKYMNENPSLPSFIKKAIIEDFSIEFMTLGEFYLANSSKIDSLIVCPSTFHLNEVVVGYQKYYDSNKHRITAGPVWLFKNGYLLESGVI